ncbi:MAG: winged helix-turn-helix domain-containing protein [Actinomycetota bacterium]|nr:winged helix-turn-helix domain-containing protein [Actinomycetota bacterium]
MTSPASKPVDDVGDGLAERRSLGQSQSAAHAEPRAALSPPRADGRRPATDGEWKALASVVRLRILRLCLYEPLTNKELSQRLDRNPASVLHHVRTLVLQGFLVAGEVRRGTRGSREVPYRATGKSWNLEVMPAERNIMLRTFFDEVSQVPEGRVESSRIGLQLSAEHLDEMRHRLDDVLREYAAYPHEPGGERISVFLAFHPEPS